jgi:hypothetical protein
MVQLVFFSSGAEAQYGGCNSQRYSSGLTNLFKHSARVLHDRLARLGGGVRTREIPIAEWEKAYCLMQQSPRLCSFRVLAE